MPKKLKLDINNLKVQSFVTSLENRDKTKIKAGADKTRDYDTFPCNTCDDPCEPSFGGTCVYTCDGTCLNTCDCSPETYCGTCGGATCYATKACSCICP
jgi:hypothetical protein